ncbi:MAG TPA: tRNA (adenosine(37)-N6)-threonylcarbamoyltransferase complex ATPase subunit type 1 TsaE [candidate division Zixibacteria bacterium]|nr:tRNA (adenosine(37)-N6)-threonylcarbamoyltransferase complex ATPase subunit type 1 TsaE [candidate division Zixibacteria bacterium]
MTKVLQVISHFEEETLALAEKILPLLTPQDLLVLTGELGAGKTLFVRGLAKGLGIDEMIVNSPSYTIVNEYPGKHPMYHFDLYRLGDSSELVEIGWDDYLNKDGLVVVEWGERADEFLPNRYFKIEFSIIDEKEREIVISLITDA